MALNLSMLPLLCVLSLFVTSAITITRSKTVAPIHDVSYLNRSSFPQGFIFGSASSAYQYEGAARKGGKGPSIWDTFTHKYPEKIIDGSNGDVADDSYHRYKEDIGIMKYMNLDAYRFSISWSRVLPKGKLSAGVNHEGVNYYNNLINELMANGLQPYVTLFHWDVPQALEDEYGGFLSPHIVFKTFGGRDPHRPAEDVDDKNDKTVEFRNASYHMPAWSVNILPDCKNVVFNTAKVTSQTSAVAMVPESLQQSDKVVNSFKWDIVKEKPRIWGKADFVKYGFVDLINTTKDTTDYLWHTTRASCIVKLES